VKTWKRWAAKDDERLPALLTERGVRGAAQALGRTPASVRWRLRALGLHGPGYVGGRYWSGRERYALLALVERGGSACAQRGLAWRSAKAIARMLERLGVSADQGRYGAYEAAAMLGVCYDTYRQAFLACGFRRPRHRCLPEQLATVALWLLHQAPPRMQRQLRTTNRRLLRVHDEMTEE
jgi:hypothetical protein